MLSIVKENLRDVLCMCVCVKRCSFNKKENRLEKKSQHPPPHPFPKQHKPRLQRNEISKWVCPDEEAHVVVTRKKVRLYRMDALAVVEKSGVVGWN